MSKSWTIFSTGCTGVEEGHADPYPVCLTSTEDTASHVVGALQVVFPNLRHSVLPNQCPVDENGEICSQIERVIRGEISAEHHQVVKTALDTLQRYPYLGNP